MRCEKPRGGRWHRWALSRGGKPLETSTSRRRLFVGEAFCFIGSQPKLVVSLKLIVKVISYCLPPSRFGVYWRRVTVAQGGSAVTDDPPGEI